MMFPGINFGRAQERNYRAQNFQENDRRDRKLELSTENNLRRFCGRSFKKKGDFVTKRNIETMEKNTPYQDLNETFLKKGGAVVTPHLV